MSYVVIQHDPETCEWCKKTGDCLDPKHGKVPVCPSCGFLPLGYDP